MPVRVRDEEDDEFEGDDFDAGFDEESPRALGPDERDRDLMDGSWEQRYYAGEAGGRDWNAVYVGLAILFLAAIIVPAILMVTQ